MGQEAVFYFDILGFREMPGETAAQAVEALNDLATILGQPQLLQSTAKWKRAYALSDSVFLTHDDPIEALALAGELVFNLVGLNVRSADPVFVRGGVGVGEVRHVGSILSSSSTPANLIGEGVVRAVRLAEGHGLKGPRIFLAEETARLVEGSLPNAAEWQLAPTAVSGVWELLWLLPRQAADWPQEELWVSDICNLAVRLLSEKGSHPGYGEHYRELFLLAARSVERIRIGAAKGTLEVKAPLDGFFPVPLMDEIFESTTGLPATFVEQAKTLLGR